MGLPSVVKSIHSVLDTSFLLIKAKDSLQSFKVLTINQQNDVDGVDKYLLHQICEC